MSFIFNGTGAASATTQVNEPFDKGLDQMIELDFTPHALTSNGDIFGANVTFLRIRSADKVLRTQVFAASLNTSLVIVPDTRHFAKMSWPATPQGNGQLDLDGSVDSITKGTTTPSTTFKIGDSGAGSFFKGEIFSLEVYDESFGGHVLMHSWAFDEGSGTTFNDSVGGLHLTFAAGIGEWVGGAPPEYGADLTAPSFSMVAEALDVVQDSNVAWTAYLSTTDFSIAPVGISVDSQFDAELSAPDFKILPRDTTVTARVDYTADLSTTSFNIVPHTIDVVQEIQGEYGALLNTLNFQMSTTPVTINPGYLVELDTPAMVIAPNDLRYEGVDYTHILSVPEFNILGIDLDVSGESGPELIASEFNMQAVGINIEESVGVILSTPDFLFTAVDLDTLFRREFHADLTTANFNFTAQRILMADTYDLYFDTIGGTYSLTGLTVRFGGNAIGTVTADGTHSFLGLTEGLEGNKVNFQNVALNDFVGDVDNVRLYKS